MDQKRIFLDTEGDAWHDRNRGAWHGRSLPDDDPLLLAIEAIPMTHNPRVLEIGCGDGSRLAWLAREKGAQVAGIDPSAKSVSAALAQGVEAERGTADALPYEDASFDWVIFGFCLYLCDADLLFKVAAEADRVLRTPGWIIINDFYSPEPRFVPYRHHSGVRTLKMDFRTLFVWHPAYRSFSQSVGHHDHGGHTDDPEQWVATSILQKAGYPKE